MYNLTFSPAEIIICYDSVPIECNRNNQNNRQINSIFSNHVESRTRILYFDKNTVQSINGKHYEKDDRDAFVGQRIILDVVEITNTCRNGENGILSKPDVAKCF